MTKKHQFLTPDEAAKLKGVSRTAIYSAIAQGRLSHTRVLGRLALREADVLAWTLRRGRPKGISPSQETRARMAESQRRTWAKRKQTTHQSPDS